MVFSLPDRYNIFTGNWLLAIHQNFLASKYDIKQHSDAECGFSLAGLDRAKLGVNQFQSFLFIVVIVTSILLKPTF